MSVGCSILVLLLGHFLADFYLQGNRTAQAKYQQPRMMYMHVFQYALCMLPFVACVLPIEAFVWGWLILSLSHVLIDFAKMHFYSKRGDALALFAVDQVGHIFFVFFVALVFFDGNPGVLFGQTFENLIQSGYLIRPLTVILSLLVAYRPTRILVQHILDRIRSDHPSGSGNSVANENQENTTDAQKAGRWIGILERTIIVILTLYGQFSAIAFVFAAKSIARYKLLDDQEFAENYLVGTLSSVAAAIAFTLAIQNIAQW